MQPAAQPNLLDLAIRHWWLTTGIGAALSGGWILALDLIDGGNENWPVYAEVATGIVGLGTIGWFCGLLGLWWVRLIFRWAVTTTRPRLVAGTGLLLTYLLPIALFFLAFPRFGALLLTWCAASLLALRWVPLQVKEYK